MTSARSQFDLSIILWLAPLVLFCSSAIAQQAKRTLIMRDMRTGKDTVVQSFETPNVPFDTARAIRYWDRLKKGLTEGEVTKLLGRPARRQFDPENALQYWWYAQRAVAFNTITRKVSFWDK